MSRATPDTGPATTTTAMTEMASDAPFHDVLDLQRDRSAARVEAVIDRDQDQDRQTATTIDTVITDLAATNEVTVASPTRSTKTTV